MASKLSHNDGPWKNPDDYQKINGLLTLQPGRRAQRLQPDGAWLTTASGIRAIKSRERAIDARARAVFGSLDDTTGGDSQRYSLQGEWHRARRRIPHTKMLRLRFLLRPRSLLELHLLPRRPDARRSVRAKGSALGRGARRQPDVFRPLGRALRREHLRPASAERLDRQRPLQYRRAPSRGQDQRRRRQLPSGHHPAGRNRPDQRRRLLSEQTLFGRTKSGPSPACAPTSITTT